MSSALKAVSPSPLPLQWARVREATPSPKPSTMVLSKQEPSMPAHTAVVAQLEVLSIAVQEIARALAPATAATAAKVADAVRQRVASSAALLNPNSKADASMSTELATLLRALSIDAHRSDQ